MSTLPNYPAIRKILDLLKSHSWIVPTVAILGALGSFAEGFGIGLLIPLLGIVLHQQVDLSATLPFLGLVGSFLRSFSELQAVLLLGAGMLALIAVKAVLTFVTALLSARVNGRINDDLRRRLFQKILRMDYESFVGSDQSRMVNAFETQTWRVLDAMLSLFDFVITLCSAFAIGILLLLISWRLTIAVLAMAAGVWLLAGRPMTRGLNRLSDAALSSTMRITRRVLAILGGMRVVRAFGRESFEQVRFENMSADAARIAARIYLVQRTMPPLFETAYVPIFIGAVVMAHFASIPVPTLLVFLLLFSRLQPQIQSVVHDYVFIASSAGAVLELAGLVDMGDTTPRRDGAVEFQGLKREVEFRNVSFDYRSGSDGRRALSGASFKLQSRQMTAIVGTSGAGKTTAINLLYRLYEPTEGEILVDGVPLPDLELATWRTHMALAGQDAPLIDGSIFENIAYGRIGASREAIISAARSAAIDEFVETLPRGYETEVGDRGLRLSEGQRQRIGLARALLREPGILVLDEATSALDGLTERVVHQTMDRLHHRKTLVVIAHRLSTVRKADQVIVLSDGKVVEQGPPAELLSRSGAFALLHSAQVDSGSDSQK